MKRSKKAHQDILDERYMAKTIDLAKKGLGKVSPNPVVGAIIVKKNRIISCGYHKRCGLDHAEIDALKKIKTGSLKGATLYVNLEPCFHFGRTPPCVDRIIECGFSRVVIGAIDPNPLVSARSVKKMRRAGIKVKTGVLKEECIQINEIFFKNIKGKRPFTVSKIAQSLDGKSITPTGRSKWITSSLSRKKARSLRDTYDAVLVGVNTVLKDNPRLNGLKSVPLKVILDPRCRTPEKLNLFKPDPKKVIIFVSSKFRQKAAGKRFPPQTAIRFLKTGDNGAFSVKSILKSLFSLGVMSVFVEGGALTHGIFFKSRLVDKSYFFIAPSIIGSNSKKEALSVHGSSSPKGVMRFKNMDISKIGPDILVSCYPEYKILA